MLGFKNRKSNLKESENLASVRLIVEDEIALIAVSGDWLLDNKHDDVSKVLSELSPDIRKLSFDTSALGVFDSSFVGMLLKCFNFCKAKSICFDWDTLPDSSKELLRLAVAVPEAASSRKETRQDILNVLGSRTIRAIDSFSRQCEFIGELTIAAVKAIRGKARYRICDLLAIIQASGPEALPIVALISFLVGLILAFVGAIQLAKYGSQIFVADLVGIAMVREMGAIMVGIVMSGRTGAAFAAELGSMKVNEEISAFRTFGISPIEFLVFPRVLALVLMFPLLTVFADIIGMLGGFVIGAGMFDISYDQYVNRTLEAMNLVQISTGIMKSFVFGVIVACIGCRMGLQCENSSAGVGMATTSSVVQSITWIIIADAVFAVIFTIFDI